MAAKRGRGRGGRNPTGMCMACAGSGKVPCDGCQGTGKVSEWTGEPRTCPVCRGRGGCRQTCGDCNGEGRT